MEHPDNTSAGTAKIGGQVYVYNAVITRNYAKYGGGVAGCGSSSVEICSVDGIAVYGNTATPVVDDFRFEPSNDLYTDGGGTVDSMMMGGVQATWSGVDESGESVEIKKGAKPFDKGFYLTAGQLTPEEENRIKDCATVYIEGNTSGSGGGGVGGNGYIKLGLKAPDSQKYTLELRKTVSGSVNNIPSDGFAFTIELRNGDGPVSDTYPCSWGTITRSGQTETKTVEGTGTLTFTNGSCPYSLGDQQYIEIQELPPGMRYTITEIQVSGYEIPDIKGTGAITIAQNGYGASGSIGSSNQVTFTNIASYALPSTGGVTPDLYYLIGCALMIATAGMVYKRRVRRGGCSQ